MCGFSGYLDEGFGFVENWMDLANALNAAVQQGAGVPLLRAEQASALVEQVTNRSPSSPMWLIINL